MLLRTTFRLPSSIVGKTILINKVFTIYIIRNEKYQLIQIEVYTHTFTNVCSITNHTNRKQ